MDATAMIVREVAAHSPRCMGSPHPCLLVVSDIGIQGNIIPVHPLVELLQVAADNGARRARVLQMDGHRIHEFNPDELKQVDPVFCGDLSQAANGAPGMN